MAYLVGVRISVLNPRQVIAHADVQGEDQRPIPSGWYYFSRALVVPAAEVRTTSPDDAPVTGAADQAEAPEVLTGGEEAP